MLHSEERQGDQSDIGRCLALTIEDQDSRDPKPEDGHVLECCKWGLRDGGLSKSQDI